MEYSLTTYGVYNVTHNGRLNPCCNGILPDLQVQSITSELCCLNPCCNGILPDTLTESYLRFLPYFSFLWNVLKYQRVSFVGVFYKSVICEYIMSRSEM